MRKIDREMVVALITAGCVLFAGAFMPYTSRSAWWCTTFSISCSEAIGQQTPEKNAGQVEFRWRIADWLRSLGA